MSDDESPSSNGAPSAGPLLPERAFVVHLRSREAGDDVFVGRIEHIVSGEVRRFASGAELLASLAEIDRAR
jgi:hypothetical protein